MLRQLRMSLWGELYGEELKKFILLSIGFFFLIGPYWLLKTLKNSIFLNLVGAEYHPKVKMLSLLLSFPLVLGYSKLIDYFSKEKMVYLLVSTYGAMGLVFTYCFYHPQIGLLNTTTDPKRLVGWLFFLYVESYIALMISLYWSFVNDITIPESAKRGYGLLMFGSQFGGVTFMLLGSMLAADAAHYTTRAPLTALIAVIAMLAIIPITFILEKTVDKKQLQGYEDLLSNQHKQPSKQGVGFFEGLRVMITQPYVAGIFGLVFFHELVAGIMSFQMMLLAQQTLANPGSINKFFFDFGLGTQGIACFFAIFGTSYFQRKFDVRFSIMAYPILLCLAVTSYIAWPTLSTVFYVMLIEKAIHYALQHPAREILYIPTSKNIKYKAKIWTEMFGLRFAKGASSVVNDTIGSFLRLAGGLSMSILAIWILLASYLGKWYQKTIKDGDIIT